MCNGTRRLPQGISPKQSAKSRIGLRKAASQAFIGVVNEVALTSRDARVTLQPHRIDPGKLWCHFLRRFREKLKCNNYRSSKWHYRQRKILFELNMHFIADTDTDENYFGIVFCSRYRNSCSLQARGGGIADQNCFGHNFYFIADTDTEKYYF